MEKIIAQPVRQRWSRQQLCWAIVVCIALGAGAVALGGSLLPASMAVIACCWGAAFAMVIHFLPLANKKFAHYFLYFGIGFAPIYLNHYTSRLEGWMWVMQFFSIQGLINFLLAIILSRRNTQ